MSQSQRSQDLSSKQRELQTKIEQLPTGAVTGKTEITEMSSTNNRFTASRSPLGTPVLQSGGILSSKPSIGPINSMEVTEMTLQSPTATIQGDIELPVKNNGVLPLRGARQYETSVTFLVGDKEHELFSGASETMSVIAPGETGSVIYGWDLTLTTDQGLKLATQAEGGNLTTKVKTTIGARLYSETFEFKGDVKALRQ
jgi:hypothetical protein